MPFEPGTLLHHRYRIESMLGKGGMGAVYLASDETLQIRVAVKENLNVNPEAERQFHREASLLASLRHPNLPRVTDHFIEQDRQYLVMDYIEGVDLHTHAKHRAPSVDEVLRWADALCSALTYLHTRTPPVIHRDIKPSNVKLHPDGTIVLVDFGLAKVFDQHQTTTGARGLTPGFSPPEQYGGQRTDARTDQYALAASLYALLTGRPPADSIERMLKKEELAPAAQLNPGVSPSVDAALTRAMALEQDERFPDIASFHDALRGLAQAPTIHAQAPTIRAQAPTIRAQAPSQAKTRRFPIWALAGAGGLIVLIALAAGGYALLGGMRGAAPPPSSTPLPGGAEATAAAAVIFAMPSPTNTLPATSTLAPTSTHTQMPTPTPGPRVGGARGLAFVSDREDSRTLQIWTMDGDGSQPRQLTFGPGDKTQPRWSPDGKRLLFVAPGGNDNFGNSLGLDIWVMNADGSGIQNVTVSPGDDTDPAWSADGTWIAWAGDRINELKQVFIIPSDCLQTEGGCGGVRPRNVSAGFAVEYSPAWSSDASRLAVAASINGAPGRIYIHDLAMPDQGTPVPTPVKFDRRDRIIGADHLRWSPDEAFFVFTWRQPTTNEIYLVLLSDPTSPEKLTNSAGNKDPALSPDGSMIAFTSTRDQNPEIYLMSVSGANEVNLTNAPGSRDQQPDWQP
jgi:Tol biopolymer transport system component/predicted Ser/Thr protein kinase